MLRRKKKTSIFGQDLVLTIIQHIPKTLNEFKVWTQRCQFMCKKWLFMLPPNHFFTIWA